MKPSPKRIRTATKEYATMPFPVFDLHCDTADRIAWTSLDKHYHQLAGLDRFDPNIDGGEPDTELKTNGCHLSLDSMGDVPWAQCFACFIYDEFSPEDSVGFYRQVMAHLADELKRNASLVASAQNASDIRPALEATGRMAIRTIENARLFAADPNLVEKLADAGVLMASLSWNAQGPLASGHDVEDAGITPLGAEVIRRMEDARMILDVSHLNDTCFDDVVRLTTRPFVASHSNSRAVCGHLRNLTDAQFAEIRDRGGLVGLNYCPAFLRDDSDVTEPTADDLCRHIEHWLDLGGEDVVALGSDFDGTDLPTCISSAAKMPELQEVFVKRFGESITCKLCADNALAFFERWGR